VSDTQSNQIAYVEFLATNIEELNKTRGFFTKAFGWGYVQRACGRRFHFKDPSGSELAAWSE